MAALKRAYVKVITLPVIIYKRLVSPFIGQVCRFYPSCSDYSKEAFEVHGLLRGLILTLARICRCQPLCKGGIDPVPLAMNFNLRKKTCFRKSEDI